MFFRQVISSVLLFFFIFALMVQTWKIPVTQYWYQKNVDYITAKYCKNLDKPELMCNGKCQLKKILKLEEPSDNPANIVHLVHLNDFYLYYQNFDKSLLSKTSLKLKDPKFSNFDFYKFRYLSDSFRPPQV